MVVITLILLKSTIYSTFKTSNYKKDYHDTDSGTYLFCFPIELAWLDFQYGVFKILFISFLRRSTLFFLVAIAHTFAWL